MKIAIAALLAAFLVTSAAAQQPPAPHTVFELRFPDKVIDTLTGAELKGPFSGRIVVSATVAPADYTFPPPFDPAVPPAQRYRQTRADMENSMNFFKASRNPNTAFLAAMEVTNVKPGDVVQLNLDANAAPKAYSDLPAGTYAARIIFDVNHDLAFSNNDSTGDLSSAAQTFRLPAERVTFTVPGIARADLPEFNVPTRLGDDGKMVYGESQLGTGVRTHTRDISFLSPSLSAFYGRETRIRGRVLLPPGYDGSKDAYPVIFRFDQFGESFNSISLAVISGIYQQMYGGAAGGYTVPPTIWVFLDPVGPTGAHAFAESANNGPWGKALTEELIPYLETQYRMDAKPAGRFLYGEEAGGWTALWLQTTYPKLFGGAWSVAPDPVDFHDFFNTDIYAPNANVFFAADGKPKPYRRQADEVTSVKVQSDYESVQGPHGQFGSFDSTFSPRGANGKPAPMFDRFTGAVDPKVAAYWREHYDLADIVRRNASALKPDLAGKLHLFVGTEDMRFRHPAAQRLKDALAKADIPADINVLQNRGFYGDWFDGATRAPADMYAIARPTSEWRPTRIQPPKEPLQRSTPPPPAPKPN